MRILLAATAALFATAPALATKPTPETLAGGPEEAQSEPGLFVENNTYRFAQPYRSERGTSPEACAHMCSSDNNCASWSLTAATFQMGPRCELKRTPGRTSYRPGTVSGLSATLMMDPTRDAVMRYDVSVPESRQPEAVELDALAPSPAPRVFGDPLPPSEPELQGADALVAPAPAPSPSPKPAKLGQVQPMQAAAPLKLTEPISVAPVSAPVVKAAAKPEPVVAAAPAPAPVAIAAPLPAPVARPQATPEPAAKAGAPIAFRTPWTERQGNDADYSVEDGSFVPGDEDASAGLISPGS